MKNRLLAVVALLVLLTPVSLSRFSITAARSTKSYVTLDNAQLNLWAQGINDGYFGGKLPNVPVQWGDLTLLQDIGITLGNETPNQIVLDRKMNPSDKQALMTLLHEECHVATWNKQLDVHGSLWKKCMIGLADAHAMDDLW